MEKRKIIVVIGLMMFILLHLAVMSQSLAGEKNLALDGLVSTGSKSGVSGTNLPHYAVDGRIEKGNALWFGPYPCWFQVDFGEVLKIQRIHIYPWWGGGRYYQYYIEVSQDEKKWQQVVDARKRTEPETKKGSIYNFNPTKARFVRVTFTYNSATKTNPNNKDAHLVELEVFGGVSK